MKGAPIYRGPFHIKPLFEIIYFDHSSLTQMHSFQNSQDKCLKV